MARIIRKDVAEESRVSTRDAELLQAWKGRARKEGRADGGMDRYDKGPKVWSNPGEKRSHRTGEPFFPQLSLLYLIAVISPPCVPIQRSICLPKIGGHLDRLVAEREEHVLDHWIPVPAMVKEIDELLEPVQAAECEGVKSG